MGKTIGNFTFNETSIEGVYKIDVKKYGDNRGYFMETYKEADFFNSKVIQNLDEFKKISDVILANRMSEELSDVKDKVYTRDLYSRD